MVRQDETDVRQIKNKLYAIGGIPSRSVEISISGGGGSEGEGVSGGETTSGSISSLSVVESFSSSDYEELELTLPGDFVEIVYGKIYFDQPLAGEFSDLIRLEIYTNEDRVDNQLNYIAEIPLRYTTLTSSASPLDNLISVTDGNGFDKDDLLYIMPSDAEFRRISSVLLDDLSMMSSIESSHSLGTGVSKVGELGGFSFYDSSNNSKMYITLKFPSNQTCSVKLDLLVRG